MSTKEPPAFRVRTVTAEDVELIETVFGALRLRWADLDRMADTSRHNLRAYVQGRTRMPNAVRRQLSASIYAHVERLEALAVELAVSCDDLEEGSSED